MLNNDDELLEKLNIGLSLKYIDENYQMLRNKYKKNITKLYSYSSPLKDKVYHECILDSGCTRSVCGILDYLDNVSYNDRDRKSLVTTADGTQYRNTGVGYIGKLRVLYVPELKQHTLISVRDLIALEMNVMFNSSGCHITHKDNNEITLSGIYVNNMYMINIDVLKEAMMKIN
jgi:hypothetical protein